MKNRQKPLKRKTRLRKETKVTAERLRHKAVTLAKRIVRMQAKFTCAYCGKQEPNVKTHGSHIYSEGAHRSMSADLDNILCLCYTHHVGGFRNSIQPSWHNNPVEMMEWFTQNYPELYQSLRARSRLVQTADEQYWTNKLADLEALLQTAQLNQYLNQNP